MNFLFGMLFRIKNGEIMKCNIGKADKIVRIIVGLIIGALGYYYKSWWGLVGLVPLITAFTNFCPLYTVVGTSTKKDKA